MDNDEKKDETVKISLDKESAQMVDENIRAGDLLSAHEYGYHRGYMKAFRDATFVIFVCLMLTLVMEKFITYD